METMTTLSFFVPGKAQTSGSKHGFAMKKNGVYTGKVLMTPANPHERDWKNAIAAWAVAAMQKAKIERPIDSAVRLDITFVMARPKYHYRTNGQLKPNAPRFHTSTPDRTKLLRCAEDALNSIVWRDDSQVCTGSIEKVYGPVPGAQITITEEVQNNHEPIGLPASTEQATLPI